MKKTDLRFHFKRQGFTLLEVSTALGLMLSLGLAVTIMVQQHVTFMTLASRQTFLASEAPKIGNLLGRIFNQADHYFVYSSLAAAQGGGAPVLSGGKAVRLFFKAANQDVEERIISVEDSTDGAELRFYALQDAGTSTSWTITTRIQDASFSAAEGILSATLQGPNGEEITYYGGAR